MSRHPPLVARARSRARQLRVWLHSVDTGPRLVRLGSRLVEGVKALCFWTAVVFPTVYLPLLVGGVRGGERVLFVGLLGTHGVSLVLGHGRGGTRGERDDGSAS